MNRSDAERNDAHERSAGTSTTRQQRLPPEPSIGDLVTHLGEETKHLVEVQVRLAKMQALDVAAASLYDGVRFIIAASVIGMGGLCLLIALVLGLSVLLDSFWLGALTSGLLLVATGAVMLWRAAGTLTIPRILPPELLAQVRQTLKR